MNKFAALFLVLGFPAVLNASSGAGQIVDGIFVLTSPTSEENSPFEELRKEIFPGKTLENQGCVVVSSGVGEGHAAPEENLQKTIDALTTALKSRDEAGMLALFHPRLEVTRNAVQNVFAIHTRTQGGHRPEDVSVYRLWALNTVDGNPELIDCESDALSLRPQYGYPLQFGLWLEMRGTKELGRIYVGLVPVKKEWKIGVFHQQQWTHLEKDSEVWLADGLKLKEQGNKMAAYVYLDVAYKLMDGSVYINTQLRKDLEATRNDIMPTDDWLKGLRSHLKDYEIVYAATTMNDAGAGLLVRHIVDHNQPQNDMRADCRKLVETIYRANWAAPLDGVKCSMVARSERHDRDGVFGSVSYNRSHIQQLKSKDTN